MKNWSVLAALISLLVISVRLIPSGAHAQVNSGDGLQGDRDNRITIIAKRETRGNTVTIKPGVIIAYCGDLDGCQLRLGMSNWDGAGRVASRGALFYYNHVNRAWRASLGDASGSDFDGTTQHILTSFACYFTDGEFANWEDKGDREANFGLLSWNQYEADCVLTIID